MTRDYLNPDDVRGTWARETATAPDPDRAPPTPPTPPPAPPRVIEQAAGTWTPHNVRSWETMGQQLLAMRAQIDAMLLVIDGVLAGPESATPMVASSFEVEEECEHPRDRRIELAVLGDPSGAHWQCRDCGHINKG